MKKCLHYISGENEKNMHSCSEFFNKYKVWPTTLSQFLNMGHCEIQFDTPDLDICIFLLTFLQINHSIIWINHKKRGTGEKHRLILVCVIERYTEKSVIIRNIDLSRLIIE